MMMKRAAVLMLGLLVIGAAVPAHATEPLRGMGRSNAEWNDDGQGLPSSEAAFVASANGFAQVPAVLTDGRALFRAKAIDGGNAMEFELRFELDGPLERAMLHVGQQGVNGAPVVVLCMPEPPGSGGGSTNICPDGNSGTFTGVILAEDVMPSAGDQGVHDLETLFAAMAMRITYVEIWSGLYQNHGEVRGQVAPLRLSDSGLPGGPGGSGPDNQDVEPN